MSENLRSNDELIEPKLSIELVPSTCWYSNVRSLVPRRDWEKLKKMVRERSGNRCEICGGQGGRWAVEYHEVWHYNGEALIQKLFGAAALCPACHGVKHFALTCVRGYHEEAFAHLMKVNGWDHAKAREYIHQQGAIHSWRSKYEWFLDLSWLESVGIAVPETRRRKC